MDEPSTPPAASVAVSKFSPATIGSVILVVSFFLPWINFLGIDVAGYNLHKIWDPGHIAWIIPILACAAAILGAAGRDNVAFAQLAGGIPFVLLAVGWYRLGRDIWSLISFGGYVTLLCGLFLLCVVPRLRKPKKTPDTAS